jgi:protein FAM32A
LRLCNPQDPKFPQLAAVNFTSPTKVQPRNRLPLIMPNSDYTSASGGALKLKGGNITKKKKKKPRPADASSSSKAPEKSKSPEKEPAADSSLTTNLHDEDDILRKELEQDIKVHGRTKTEAERRFEEHRRKRLDERLKKEGVKTHKERVEELNRYLSRLSEHHDMPRIGPG